VPTANQLILNRKHGARRCETQQNLVAAVAELNREYEPIESGAAHTFPVITAQLFENLNDRAEKFSDVGHVKIVTEIFRSICLIEMFGDETSEKKLGLIEGQERFPAETSVIE
jgi:hypothetical protein